MYKHNYNYLIFKNLIIVQFGDWGLGIGDWAQSPIPNPQSPIPNPHRLFKLNKIKKLSIKFDIHNILKLKIKL